MKSQRALYQKEICHRHHDHLPLQPRHRHLRRLLDCAVGEEVSPVARVVVGLMTGMMRIYADMADLRRLDVYGTVLIIWQSASMGWRYENAK